MKSTGFTVETSGDPVVSLIPRKNGWELVSL